MNGKISIIIFLFLLVISCSYQSEMSEKLSAVESIMEEHPDSALQVLNAIDTLQLQSQHDKALYALLLSQALDKNYIDTPNTNIIQSAVDYFENSGDTYHSMLAHYYQGRVLYNAGQYSLSLISALKAYDEAEEVGDSFWLGMTARAVSDTYSHTYSYIECLEYCKKAYRHFKATDRQKHINWAYWDLSVAYRNCELWDDCIKIATHGLDSARKYNDQRLAYNLTREKGIANFNAERYSESIKWYSKLCAESPYATVADSAFLGISYKRIGETDKAEKLLSVLSPNNSAYSSWLQYEVAMAKGDSSTAFNALKVLDNDNNRTLSTLMVQNVSGAVSQYLDSERQLEETRAEMANTRLWIICITAVLIFIAGGITAVYHYRKHRAVVDENVHTARNLREILALKDDMCLELQKDIDSLLGNHFKTIDDMCCMFIEKSATKNRKGNISKALCDFIEDFSNNKTKTLEQFVDKYYDNAMSELKCDLPNLKDSDYRLYLYSVLGFSSGAIALFLHEENISAVYDRKRHLKDKIKKLESGKQEKYIKPIS